MNKQLSSSIESMEKVIQDKEANLWLVVDKINNCIAVTKDKNLSSPVYEIADWVQLMANHTHSKYASNDLKKLHKTFLKVWDNYISELTVSR